MEKEGTPEEFSKGWSSKRKEKWGDFLTSFLGFVTHPFKQVVRGRPFQKRCEKVLKGGIAIEGGKKSKKLPLSSEK